MTRLLTKDFLAGLLFVAFGAAFLWLGSELRLGTPRSMGPGFVPRLLSLALIGLGGFLSLRAIAAKSELAEFHNPRALLLITASVAFFTFAFERFGLVPAAAGLVVLAAWARPDWRRIETVVTMLVLLAISIAIFKVGLGMTFPSCAGCGEMELFDNVWMGFSVALSWKHLLYCLLGVVVGTLIGVLPGIGPVATISMLLPITYHLGATKSLIMLAGIYYGAQYGGSTTAILVNLPGEASSVVTCLDGYRMAQQGKGGTALAVAALGSLFAGTVGTALIVVAGPSLAKVGLSFGPAEYTALMALGLIAAVVLASGSIVKAIGMVFLGLLIGLTGIDVNDGTQRFTWGILELSDGIDFVPIAMGLFGVAEVITQLERRSSQAVGNMPVNSLLPSKADLKRMLMPMLRGTALGSILGVLPGGGPVLASFASYTVEKKISRTPEKFGTGMIEGVAAPESANNAAAQTSFIPMLTLGIPSNAVMALMIGAMIIAGIQPGPNVMTTKPELFWGVVASMWIGNLLLVIINLPMVGIWVKLLTVPYRFLYPAILLFCCIGAYSIQNSTFHLMLLVGAGVLGYVFVKLGCEPAPFLLGMVLGPQMEEYFRRAMRIAGGDPAVFIERPLSAALLGVAVLLLIVVIVPAIRQARQTTFQE